MLTQQAPARSWWSRTFGRSVLEMLLGNKFFEKKANVASIVALLLVLSICYVIVVKEKFEYMNFLLNIVFVVIGYYFGAKQEAVAPGEDQSSAEQSPNSASNANSQRAGA